MIELQIKREEEQKEQGRLAFLSLVEKAKSKGQESNAAYGVNVMKGIVEVVSPLFVHYFQRQQELSRTSSAYNHVFKPAFDYKVERKSEELALKELTDTVSFLFAQTLADKVSDIAYVTPTVCSFYKKLSRSFNIRIEDDGVYQSVIASLSQLSRHFIDAFETMHIEIEPRKKVRGRMVGGQSYIRFDETVVNELGNFVSRIADKCVFYKPMIVKPVKHKNLTSGDGGFLTIRSPLIKRHIGLGDKKRLHPIIKGFNSDTNPEFFDLINTHQEVGFKINKEMLEVLPVLQASGVTGDSFDYCEGNLYESLVAGANQEIIDTDTDRVEMYGDEAHLLTDKAKERILKKWLTKGKQAVNLYNATLTIANEYVAFDTFYFPVFLDNRGRIYYYGKELNPQGNELHKALLQFSEGVEMTDETVIDSYIALGNAMGYDKKTVEFRIGKAKEVLQTILEGSIVDIANLMDEETRLTGIAIALDIRAYHRAKARGETYITYQPLHMDSCNSGSQINGLLLRDYLNCKKSNIINVEGEDLEDVYKSVAVETLHKMENDTSGVFSKFLMHPEVFHRTVFKKSSMTRNNYAASFITCAKDIKYQIRNRFPEVWGKLNKADKDIFVKAAVDQIDAASPASNNYKKFARKLIGEVMKRDGVLAYHQPRSGFPVVLCEFKEVINKVRYNEMYTGKSKTFHFINYTNNVDKRATVSSSIPGITHSFDAGIIMDVKRRCGNIPMVTIHDSIAVLAGHVSTKLLPAIRETYADMLVSDDLETIRKELDVEIEIPYSNTFTDPSVVLNSKHLYS